jgi:uracil-DNA glycosylase
LKLLVGKYAQDYYLGTRRQSLAATVRQFEHYLPEFFPLPHPSPRNIRWFRNHPWFEAEVLPVLQTRISTIIGRSAADKPPIS